MRPDAWRPTYDALAADLGIDESADAAARDELDALLADRGAGDLSPLRAALAGREVFVVGGAATREDVDDLPVDAQLLVADGAIAVVGPGRTPAAIVTDLDGDLARLAAANARGVLLLVHAHGDNRPALAHAVPRFTGPLVGTTQVAPRGRVLAFGGFTDGDRACCLAEEMGAASLALVGFDFETPAPKPGQDVARKRRKLAWARRIVEGLGVPVRYVVSSSTHAR